MSFSLYASGTNGFVYERNNCPDDDIFEAAQIIAALNSTSPSAGGVIAGVAEYMLPSVSMLDGVNAVAKMQMMHLLMTNVSLLAQRSNASRGWISVRTEKARILFPPRVSFARYNFNNDDDPGTEFIRTILPALTSTDFNNYGVFRALALAIREFDQCLDSSLPPMIMMFLNK